MGNLTLFCLNEKRIELDFSLLNYSDISSTTRLRDSKSPRQHPFIYRNFRLSRIMEAWFVVSLYSISACATVGRCLKVCYESIRATRAIFGSCNSYYIKAQRSKLLCTNLFCEGNCIKTTVLPVMSKQVIPFSIS